MSRQNLEETLKALRSEYSAKLPSTLAEIESDWQQLQAAWEASCFRRFHRQIHRIAGNAKTFGFSVLTDVAHQLDEYLVTVRGRGTAATAEEFAQIDMHVRQLRRAMSMPDDPDQLDALLPSENEARPQQSQPLIYVVDDDPDACEWVEQQLLFRGYQVRTFTQLQTFRHHVRQKPPAVAIIDIMFAEGNLAGPQVMASIQRERNKPLPVIFISARADITARLAAVRANGDGYFTKPLNMNAVQEKLQQLCQQDSFTSQPVLIVDDGNQYGERYARLLQQTGLRVKLLSKPLHILETLKQFQPTLVLINSQLKELSGLELALVIRQQINYSHLPIIFFAQQFDQTLRRAAMRGVADDFISDTITPEQLLAVVINRLKHIAQQQEQQAVLQQRDTLTGLYNRQYLLSQLDYAHDGESNAPLVVLYLTVDNHRSIERIIGLDAVDVVLKDSAQLLQELTDPLTMVAARLGDQCFVVMSRHSSLMKMQQLAERIRQARAEREISYEQQSISSNFSIGIALFHHDKSAQYQDRLTSPQQTLLAAELACEQAVNQGGNQLVLHGSACLERTDAASKRRLWEQSITLAIENNDFYLVYQPIASVHGEVREYYDVLLRMRDRDSETIIKAADFMPVAEKSSLIQWIDSWVVHSAVRTLAEKHQQGESFQFFIRLAVSSLNSRELMDWIQDCFTESHLLPQAIVFDLSCPAVAEQQALVHGFVDQIRALGCQLCFRDVEPSEEHFKLIETFEVEFVKLHSRLMQSLTESSRQQSGVMQLVKFAHTHNCQVIAPFVENAATLTLLWQKEVDYIGGHFVQKPTTDLNFDFSE